MPRRSKKDRDASKRAVEYSYVEERTGKPAYELWLQRCESVIRRRKSYWNGDDAWKRYLKMYRGDQWDFRDDGDVSSDNVRDRITVNKTGSIINDFQAFLVKQNPRFSAQPEQEDYSVAAKIRAALLNVEWRARDCQVQLKKSVLDLLIIGHGINKIGYQFEVDDLAKNQNKHGEILYSEYVKKDCPYLKRINPFRFYYDWESEDRSLENARWCVEVIYKPVGDVIGNSLYREKALRCIRNGEYEPQTESAYYGEQLEDFSLDREVIESDAKRIVLYEIWDKKFGKYWVFAAGVPEPLREEDIWPYDYLKGFPYEKIDFIPVPDEPYGLGIPAFIEDQQFEMNRNRTRMFEHGRRFNRKYEVMENLDPGELSKLQEGADGTIVTVPQIGSVVPIQDAPLSNDLYQIDAIINADMYELSGLDAIMRGAPLPSRTSAQEIRAKTGATSVKLDDIINSLDAHVVNIGYKMLAHLEANMTGERAVRLTGAMGEYWERFTGDDLSGEYYLDLQTTSAPRIDPATQQQLRSNIYSVIMNALPILSQAQVAIDVGQLLAWTLEPFGDKEVSRFFPGIALVNQPIMPPAKGMASPPGAPPAPEAQQAQGQAPPAPGSVAQGMPTGG